MTILGAIIIGAIAAWLGELIYKGSGLGLLGNIVVGILGGAVGSWVLGHFGASLGEGWVGSILTGALGAIIILFLVNLIFKRKS
ncbi:GlsB/YeaQ/YmgE family stress response membrane protein [Capnocytophaga canis]|uniref:GlsB/YeaQ/YmgE family stress response membrane protein n=1 Tax=Capnocytophaga canis TaxID=1848903 RepID=UPI001561E363|nr:GlsB/YeaQ/YmgE family stress response membrane protein [Capnocytophaga canis]